MGNRFPDAIACLPAAQAFFQFAMSCPICGKHCRCAEPRALSSSNVLVEVDAYDPSEEQFASSVMTGVVSPEDEEVQVLSSGTIESARARYGRMDATESQSLPSSTPTIEPANLENPVTEQNEWRNEVASRLQSYKARRRRGQGDDNMAFNFESTTGNHVFLKPEVDPCAAVEPEPAPNYYAAHACATEPVFESTQDAAAEPMDEIVSEAQTSFAGLSEPEPKARPLLETAKLIFFPKPPIVQEMRTDELADPVFDTPRILDAPEEVESEAVAIPLADITLHPDVEEDPCVPYIEPDLELPARVAPVPLRVLAELFDTLLILLAGGIFGVIVAKLNPAAFSLERHAFLGMVLLVPAVFWSVYKYLFLVFGGTTLGMQITRLRLVCFDGQVPHVVPRRYRALSMLVSIFPLGLGLLWSFVDPDRLCWHDRISRTYMTAR